MKSDFIYQGALEQLKKIIEGYGKPNIFLITGKTSYTNSGAQEKISSVLSGYETVHFHEFSTNPKLTDVLRGIELFLKNKCKLIISVGGGSVIDMAKLVNYYHNIPNTASITAGNLQNPDFGSKPHIAIPTTAGSGSEATQFAVMYIESAKYSIDHPGLKPGHILIDTSLHHSQTPYQIAVSGADAFCQAIESYWCINSSTESRAYAKKAIETIWKYLPIAFQKNENEAFTRMAEAAHWAGKAINITRTTAPHALSYAFTSELGIPHGHATALTLPYFLKYNFFVGEDDLNDIRGVTFVKERIEEICTLIHAENIDSAYLIIVNFFKKVNLDISLKNHNASQKEIQYILSRVNAERLNNNPRKPNFDHLLKHLINN